MDPIVTGSLISAGANLLGGLFSNKSNRSSMKEQIKYQREFAQHGIRWRVADAQAAGLHPLYALGANTPSYSPVYSSDAMGPALAAAGQDIGRAVAAGMTKEERAVAALSMRKLEAELAESDARRVVLRTEALRNLSEIGAGRGMPSVNMPEADLIPENASTAGGAILKAPEITMSRPGDAGMVAGPAGPAFREFALPGGGKVSLPDASSVGEALESITESWPVMWMVYKENVAKYGPEWRRDFLRRYVPRMFWSSMGIQDRSFRRIDPELERKAVEEGFNKLIHEMR